MFSPAGDRRAALRGGRDARAGHPATMQRAFTWRGSTGMRAPAAMMPAPNQVAPIFYLHLLARLVAIAALDDGLIVRRQVGEESTAY